MDDLGKRERSDGKLCVLWKNFGSQKVLSLKTKSFQIVNVELLRTFVTSLWKILQDASTLAETVERPFWKTFGAKPLLGGPCRICPTIENK